MNFRLTKKAFCLGTEGEIFEREGSPQNTQFITFIPIYHSEFSAPSFDVVWECDSALSRHPGSTRGLNEFSL